MKINELIKLLSELPQDAEIHYGDAINYYPAVKRSIQIFR